MSLLSFVVVLNPVVVVSHVSHRYTLIRIFIEITKGREVDKKFKFGSANNNY